ncbi:MAG TPA: SRPBCC family protein [Solirubrobacteraceae bacterium]|nr:SRPBCC family protein [Solirubrobacteraceae bacterium]
MLKSGDVLEIPALGVRIEFRRTAAETGGEYTEFDVVGRPRGFLVQPHVHGRTTERMEVLEGSLAMTMNGRTQILAPGESISTPPGTPHRHVGAGKGSGRVRIEHRPAGRFEDFAQDLARMDRNGEISRIGLPKPVPGARFILEYMEDARGASPPPRVQRAVARTILRIAGQASNEYVFVDEWDVDAPVDAVHAAVGDAATYPDWWRPTYLDVRPEGERGVGQVVHHHFRGPLPYTLKATTRTTRYEPPNLVETTVEGDLRGTGIWTLTPAPDGRTHVRFDWRVAADRPFLRVLTPVLRPAFRWNHNWAIARAQDGLEPYARRRAAEAPEPGVAAVTSP